MHFWMQVTNSEKRVITFYTKKQVTNLSFKSDRCVDGKHSKILLTDMAAANAAGDKLPMFVIGNRQGLDTSLGYGTFHAGTERKRRAGWIASCLWSGLENLTAHLNEKAEKLYLLWITVQSTLM